MSMINAEPTVFDLVHAFRELDKRLTIEQNAKIELDYVFYNTDFKNIGDDIKEYICAEARYQKAEGFYLGMKYALDLLVSHSFTSKYRINPEKDGMHHLTALTNYEDEES